MAKKKNKQELLEPLPYAAAKPKLKLILAAGDEKRRSFPVTEIIKSASGYDPDEIVDEGRAFAESLLQRCSGQFVEGIRQILLKNPRHYYYRPEQ